MNKLRTFFSSMLKVFFNSNQAEVVLRPLPRERERKLVATFARGNINLQSGRYTTTEDLERIKASLRGYRFSPRQ
ncbi:MAG: hypothetical protein HQL75_15210 [Magnetococcales bacterium]|nr:hypothetical protein [Magnetococcales bacterium]